MEIVPTIEIGILHGKSIKFRLAGKFQIDDDCLFLYDQCELSIEGNSIILENNNVSRKFDKELVLKPCHLTADHFELFDVTIGIDFHWEKKEKQKFQGALKLSLDEGEIHLINIIPVENYLISVISSEMNANCSLELLKAHAIISRSWLLSKINRQEETVISGKSEFSESQYISWFDQEDHKLFDVCADDHCQRYQGTLRITNPGVIQAVNETKGQVLLYENKICDTRYSKSCGGYTEVYESCWDGKNLPYLKDFPDLDSKSAVSIDLRKEENARRFILSNPESYCNTKADEVLVQILNEYDLSSKDFFRWKIEYSQKEISSLINEKSGMEFGKIIGFEPIERGSSGRLIKLRIWGTEKELLIGKELIIRKWLSPSHLYSSAIVIDSEDIVDNIPQKFIIHGAGWGHGVGLCQIGAAVMAHKGSNYKDILAHYYRGAEIAKCYS